MCKDTKSGSPLVSVIMPAYNAQAYIQQAIDSVRKQSVTDLELLVIDDGSTDDTCRIVTEISREDPRVRLLQNPENLGAAGTRNRGLELCRGRYVALLDSDDYWLEGALEKMLQRAEETGADITYCSYAIVDEEGKNLCNDFIVPESTEFDDSIVRNVISCSTVLLTGEIARNNRFPLGIYHEDIALWFKLLREGKVARGVTDVLAAYRQRRDSRSANKIKSACRRWVIYRKFLRLPFFKSVGAMWKYAYYGFIKYKKI